MTSLQCRPIAKNEFVKQVLASACQTPDLAAVRGWTLGQQGSPAGNPHMLPAGLGAVVALHCAGAGADVTVRSASQTI